MVGYVAMVSMLPDAQYEGVASPLSSSLILFTIVSALSSLVITCTGTVLCWKTRSYIKNEKARLSDSDLVLHWTNKDYAKFFKLWDAGVLFGDVCILYAIFSMHVTEQLQTLTLQSLDTQVIWLGTGCVISWLTIIRHFKFHAKFNLLFSTFYNALFDVLAYSICVVILFCGYVICGYIVLGPYHVKFSTLSVTFDSLFGMMIGNEIFVALVNVNTRNSGSPLLIWWFSRFYIYTFVGIFNILAKSLLTAILISAYRVISARYVEYRKQQNDRQVGGLGSAVMGVLHSPEDTGTRQALQELLDSGGGGRLTGEEHDLRRQLEELAERDQADGTGHWTHTHDSPLKRFVFDNMDGHCHTKSCHWKGLQCLCLVPRSNGHV